MDVANQRRTQLITQMQLFLSRLWYTLRSSKITAGLLILLTFILATGALIPQQQMTMAANATARAVWLNNLPAWLRPAGDDLYFLGFAQIFYTLWFWIPAALLFINSLIALADYAPGCWRRMRRGVPPVKWQYPLARRVEHSVRLSQFPDDFSGLFRDRFHRHNFVLYTPSSEQQRDMAAAQRRWSWLGIPLIYFGLLTLIFAFVLTFFSLQTETFTLSPLQPRSVDLLGGRLDLTAIDPAAGVSQLTFTPNEGGAAHLLSWRYYRPGLVQNVIVFPMEGDSIVTVEISDPAGNLIALDPLPENASPTEHLRAPLAEGAATSIYFTVPSRNLAVQISPETGANTFSVQIRQGDDAELIGNVRAVPGQEFEIEGMRAMLSLEQSFKVIARRDAGWPLYILAMVLIVSGGILALLRPAVVWLIPEVKGIGGQLYGVLETFGSEQKMIRQLEQLLAIEDTAAGENGE